ncbi:uncharacterized protein LOC102080165 isoform X1 [Oreochromis niloticus]|uniref:uncharacterized protein LOC102080165 isoform X1 n=2 Tax=Oreochromis niloticus TaxID=8128 RepID=UPI000DF2B951|nr:uncharacterized protein LOC102080165 isoform X1 [Oreochromis niloticus]
MKLLLMLILLLISDCESEMKRFTSEWTEFTCNCQKTPGKCQMVCVADCGSKTGKKTLRVILKQVENKDPKRNDDKKELKFKLEENGCPKQFNQTAYKKAKTTIRCNHPENKSELWFFCKENSSVCNNILSDRRSFLTNTYSVSISDVSIEDKGVYWCGVKFTENNHHVALTKVKLKVEEIKNVKRSPVVGQNFTYWCKYNQTVSSTTKFICKGEDPSICQALVNTRQPGVNNRFFMTDNTKEKNITITVREVTAADSGTYWCGAETKQQQRSNKFFNRLFLTVQPAPPSSSTPLTTTTTTTAKSHVTFGITTAVIIGVAVFLIGFFLIYIRVSCIKNKGISASLQHVKEDSAYEEIQERLQTPGNAVDSIYVTAGRYTDVTSLHYSTINFQSHSQEAGGEEVNPSTSACEYSTVDFRKRPDNSTVTQPSRPAEENLYSAVNELEQI